jgi:transposase InsO family protein
VYKVIGELSVEFDTVALCRVLGVSRSAYYAHIAGGSYVLKGEKAMISQEIKNIFTSHKRRYGWRRIQAELRDKGLEVGRHQIRNRMQEQGLVAIQPKSYVPKTTQSHAHLRRSPNLLLEAGNLPVRPNQIIVGDITYLPNQEAGYEKWLYLATWLDVKSHRIVGWQIARHMEENLVITALQKVIKTRQPQKGLIVHSDGGGQYASTAFRTLLRSHEYRQSMTRKNNHYDNAQAESLFSRFKAELLDGGVFYGLKDAYYRSFEYIDGYYNLIRKHSSIGYLSPVQYEAQLEQNNKT